MKSELIELGLTILVCPPNATQSVYDYAFYESWGRATCPTCQGTGKSEDGTKWCCEDCGGTGVDGDKVELGPSSDWPK